MFSWSSLSSPPRFSSLSCRSIATKIATKPLFEIVSSVLNLTSNASFIEIKSVVFCNIVITILHTLFFLYMLVFSLFWHNYWKRSKKFDILTELPQNRPYGGLDASKPEKTSTKSYPHSVSYSNWNERKDKWTFLPSGASITQSQSVLWS